MLARANGSTDELQLRSVSVAGSWVIDPEKEDIFDISTFFERI